MKAVRHVKRSANFHVLVLFLFYSKSSSCHQQKIFHIFYRVINIGNIKLKRLVRNPHSSSQDLRCSSCEKTSTYKLENSLTISFHFFFILFWVFSHAQMIITCVECNQVSCICLLTGGRARLTEGCSSFKKGESSLLKNYIIKSFRIID